MADIVYLDKSKSFDYEYIKALQKEGKEVHTFCCAMVESDRSDFYRGTKEECLTEVKRDPPYDAIIDVRFFGTVTAIEKIFWLNKDGSIESEEIPDEDEED